MNHIRHAVTATALIVAFAVASVFALNGSGRPAAVRVVPADGVARPSPSIPTAAAMAGFVCGASTLPAAAGAQSALIGAIRTGSHSGYDRLVIEFSSGVPASITITPQPQPVFTNSPRGDTVTLGGTAGLRVVLHDADAHTAYGGPAVLRPNGKALVEVRRIEDFEGYVGLGLGLARPSCYRAFMLTSPTRLVIDLQVA